MTIQAIYGHFWFSYLPNPIPTPLYPVPQPDMLMSKYFDIKYYNSLSDTLKARLLACCKSGAENHDSGVGVYAMQPSDYDDLKPYFDQVIRGYHKIPGEVKVR